MNPLDARTARPMEGGASFPLSNRLWRVAWAVIWLVFARFTPPPLHGWRRLVLNAAGASVAPGARVHASVRVWDPRNLFIGGNSLVGPGARLYNQGRIVIGDRTVISQRAHLCASTHAVDDPDFQLLLRPVTIGNQCWVAAEAFVGPGVTMADGSVLGARGALFEDSLADTVYRGNPAVPVRRNTRRQRA
ncbi:MAG TPA: putative colanic acid biosynthesis acetyltransferase [Croceicoccus sp.]|nr:putative colanic acid biosynthesis acetyltransferase [Croceicoccus sp.]